MESKKSVLITGISGFLGSHITKLFLEDGWFNVKGTVRDKKNEIKMAPLKEAFGEYYNKLELIEADLLNTESMRKAIENSDIVIHTASPLPPKAPKHEWEIIEPAVNGTWAVLEACRDFKVQRLVITSSGLAVLNPITLGT